MQHKRLVVDANILIRGVPGSRVRQLIADASEHVAFYVAEANYEEACRYLAEREPAWGVAAPVWAEDSDFLGAGVPTWTTETVGLYLTAP